VQPRQGRKRDETRLNKGSGLSRDGGLAKGGGLGKVHPGTRSVRSRVGRQDGGRGKGREPGKGGEVKDGDQDDENGMSGLKSKTRVDGIQ
jgi:hypothetical protein